MSDAKGIAHSDPVGGHGLQCIRCGMLIGKGEAQRFMTQDCDNAAFLFHEFCRVQHLVMWKKGGEALALIPQSVRGLLEANADLVANIGGPITDEVEAE